MLVCSFLGRIAPVSIWTHRNRFGSVMNEGGKVDARLRLRNAVIYKRTLAYAN